MAAPKIWVTDVGLEGQSVNKKISMPLRKAIKSKELLLEPIPLTHLILSHRLESKSFKRSKPPYAPYFNRQIPHFIVVYPGSSSDLLDFQIERYFSLKNQEKLLPDKYGYMRIPHPSNAGEIYYKERRSTKWQKPENTLRMVDCPPSEKNRTGNIEFNCRLLSVIWRPFLQKNIFHRIRIEFIRSRFPKSMWDDLETNTIKLLNQMKLWAEIHRKK